MAGLAPRFFGNANTAQGYGNTGNPTDRWIGGKGQMAGGYWNPFRKFGYMAPPTSMVNSSIPVTYTDATYKQDSELVAVVYDSLGTNGSNGLGMWSASKTSVFSQYKLGGSNYAFRTAVDPPLTATTPKIQDLEIYQVGGVNNLFVSYQNTAGTYGDIGIIAPDGSGWNATWFSATASGGGTYLGVLSNIVMVPGGDNYLYVLDTNNLHRIDGTALTGGTNATVTQGVLIFPAERILSDAVDFNGSLWIVAQTNSTFQASTNIAYNEHHVDVYAWNRQLTTISSLQRVPIEGMESVRRIYVTADGDLRIIGISQDRTVQIRRYNGTTFEIMQQLPIWSAPPYRDSCTSFEGMFTWIGTDGKVYAHGKMPEVQGGTYQTSAMYSQDQIYILGDMYGLANTDMTPGALLAYGIGVAGTNSSPPSTSPGLLFSYATSSGTYKTYDWILNGTGTIQSVAQKADAGNPYTLVARLPGLANVNYVRVWCLPQGSGGATQLGTFNIYKNQSGTALASGTAITQTDIQRGYTYIPIGDKGSGTFALQFSFNWATSNALSDSGDWMPYAIEVDYDEDTKLK